MVVMGASLSGVGVVVCVRISAALPVAVVKVLLVGNSVICRGFRADAAAGPRGDWEAACTAPAAAVVLPVVLVVLHVHLLLLLLLRWQMKWW
jgi:hypothetical protein